MLNKHAFYTQPICKIEWSIDKKYSYSIFWVHLLSHQLHAFFITLTYPLINSAEIVNYFYQIHSSVNSSVNYLSSEFFFIWHQCAGNVTCSKGHYFVMYVSIVHKYLFGMFKIICITVVIVYSFILKFFDTKY